jgi:nucleoid DNA-binding protein
MKLSRAEIDTLNDEILLTFNTTLTEQRYNELMDALLPTLEGSPDAQGTLEGFGQLEWRKRRIERNPKTTAA